MNIFLYNYFEYFNKYNNDKILGMIECINNSDGSFTEEDSFVLTQLCIIVYNYYILRLLLELKL